jgi:hypothetical protein
MTVVIRGNVRPRIPAKVLLMHTAHAIPCSRWMVGKTSAEYWKATGPSPIEYAMVKRYTNNTTGPIFAPVLASLGTSSDRPAANNMTHMMGKVMRQSVLRPLVSMRNRVGIVKTTCTAP